MLFFILMCICLLQGFSAWGDFNKHRPLYHAPNQKYHFTDVQLGDPMSLLGLLKSPGEGLLTGARVTPQTAIVLYLTLE